MSKANYDTKSSILSLDCRDYKIPYDLSESSRIVEHLEESQQQLEFLKLKLTEAYEKLEKEIRASIELSECNEQLMGKVRILQTNWEMEQTENRKLKEVMETMLKNRRVLEEEVEFTHNRYKKILKEDKASHQDQVDELSRQIKRLQKENEALEQEVLSIGKRESKSLAKVCQQKEDKLEHKIQLLQSEIRKVTRQKVTEVSRLKHEIECYQTTLSPIRSTTAHIKPCASKISIDAFDADENNENVNTLQGSTIAQSKLTTDSRADDDSISKWEKPKSKVTELTDDQKLTRAQMQKKKYENQLAKIERLKRQTGEDRQNMELLEKRIYEIDSQISGLKRKIRQKY